MLLEEACLYPVTQDMTAKDVRLLDAGGVLGGDAEREIGDLGRSAASFACKCDGEGPELMRRLESRAYIAAVPRGGDSDEEVPAVAEGFDLPAKDLIVPVVVSYGGED